MLFTPLTKLLPLVSFSVTITAIPAPPSALKNVAILRCEFDFTRCLRQRTDIDFCRDSVCSSYNNECTPCLAGDFTTLTDHSVPTVSKREVAKPRKNHCIIICTHAHCDLLCSNPGNPPSGSASSTGAGATTDTTDLLATTNAQPDQLGLPLTDSMTTVILAKGKKDRKRQKDCVWVCSGKLNCRQACWAAGDAQGALVMDGGSLAEGEAVDGMGDCEIVEKGDVGRLMVCNVPETAGDLDPNGMRCLIFWIGLIPHIICNKV